MNSKKIYVAGHNGMVGAAICRHLKALGCDEIITCTREQLDLIDQRAVDRFVNCEKPDQIYLAAAKVGGIHANNTYPADFIYQNIMIQANVISAAHRHDVQELLFLGSSCIYPKEAIQPIVEEALLSGPLEPTNEPYAIAKIAGIKLCESYNRQYGRDYRSVMPTNLYGPGDNYHPENSHVIPGLIRRFHEAKSNNASHVNVWGTGQPRREFLYVEDMAAASIYVMNLPREKYQEHTRPMLSHINVGSGLDISIKSLSELIAKVVGYQGKIIFDSSKPDGTTRKLMDNSLINTLGWRSEIGLEDGLRLAYDDFKKLRLSN